MSRGGGRVDRRPFNKPQSASTAYASGDEASASDLAAGSDHVLLTPGPVRISERVRAAMARADMGHRDEAFVVLCRQIREGLRRIGDASDFEALLVGAGGTGTTEAVFSSFLGQNEKILVVSNGAFGERMAEIAVALRQPLVHLAFDWGQAISVPDIENRLGADRSIKAVAMVHHETSVGRLNPVREVAQLCLWRDVRFFVDAVASFGAEEISAAAVRPSVLIGSANKCLHGVPGVGFVLVRSDCWTAGAGSPRSVFLDLRRYRSALLETGQTPFTPPIPALLALREAILELEEEGGPPARRAVYLRRNAGLRHGLAELGLKILNKAGASASVVIAELPKGRRFSEFYLAMRARGFLIYPAKGRLRDGHFLVANMGSIDEADIQVFLQALSVELNAGACELTAAAGT